MNKYSAYEMAVWRAKEAPENNKELIINTVDQGLGSLKGFVDRTIYQSVNDPQLMFDWVEWDSNENALQASKDMMTVPELKDFVGLIEKTEVFEHFSISDYHEKTQGEGNIVELIVYQLKPDADINSFKEAYSNGISHANGYKNRHILKNSKGENQWAEFVFWESIKDAQKASEAMKTNPEIGAVFQMVKEIKLVHQYFSVFE